jgi:hypothetical protein
MSPASIDLTATDIARPIGDGDETDAIDRGATRAADAGCVGRWRRPVCPTRSSEARTATRAAMAAEPATWSCF